MPCISVKVEGTTKMIKSVLVNIDEVCRAVGGTLFFLFSFFFFLGVKTPTHTLTHTYTHTLRQCDTPSVCFFCTLQHTHTYIHTIRGRVPRRQRVSVCASPRTHTHTRTPFEDVCRAVNMSLLCVSAHTHSHTCQVGIYRYG